MNQPTDTNDSPVMGDDDTYFIETFLRQKGDFRTLLAIDALVLRDDLAIEEKVAQLQQTIQGAFNG
ncbi:hypothetical protein RCH14_004527 [Massilia sp. MP_M2]|uniref:hypothetical protein n=1 Tax=Massilia sp. MP_M2 TaxID=3071713 RepID=UPI00319E7046